MPVPNTAGAQKVCQYQTQQVRRRCASTKHSRCADVPVPNTAGAQNMCQHKTQRVRRCAGTKHSRCAEDVPVQNTAGAQKMCQYQTRQVRRCASTKHGRCAEGVPVPNTAGAQTPNFFQAPFCSCSHHSAVGIKTTIKAGHSDSLRAGRSGDRIPVGPGFSAPVQTGPGAHSAFYTIGTGSFLGVMRSGRGADRTPT